MRRELFNLSMSFSHFQAELEDICVCYPLFKLISCSSLGVGTNISALLMAESEQKLICCYDNCINSRALAIYMRANIRLLLPPSPSTPISQNTYNHVFILYCFLQFRNYFHLCYLVFSKQPQELDKVETIISTLDVSKVKFIKFQFLAHCHKSS